MVDLAQVVGAAEVAGRWPGKTLAIAERLKSIDIANWQCAEDAAPICIKLSLFGANHIVIVTNMRGFSHEMPPE